MHCVAGLCQHTHTMPLMSSLVLYTYICMTRFLFINECLLTKKRTYGEKFGILFIWWFSTLFEHLLFQSEISVTLNLPKLWPLWFCLMEIIIFQLFVLRHNQHEKKAFIALNTNRNTHLLCDDKRIGGAAKIFCLKHDIY